MKVLFAHDHRFIPQNGKIWSESQFEADLWQRYLKHFETITVAARAGVLPAGKTTDALELSSAACVEFELFPDILNLQGMTIARAVLWRRMCKLVAEHDGVIARLPSEIGLLAISAARERKKPWAVEAVGCPWDAFWHYGSLAGRFYAPVAWIRMRRALAGTSHAIYVTEEFLQRRYPTQAANVGSASNVILPSVPATALQARLARIRDIESRPLRLGLIGTLRGKYKGIQTLISALSRVRSIIPPVHLHILGGGDPAPWKAEAAQFGIQDMVSFDGTLPAGDPVLNWLDNIDIYIQPSLQEGLPRALIEAMSRGSPAIASSVAGIPELLPKAELFRPGDSKALAAKLKQRLCDRDWMITSARANWEKAQEFRSDHLEARRAAFWSKFSASIVQEK